MLKEFKEFALKGNVLDLAVGVIIGGAFGKIVSSLVGDVLMPIIGILIGGIDFTKLQFVFTSVTGKEVPILYGSFIQSVVDFLIISFSIFLFIRLVSFRKNKNDKTEPVVAPPNQEVVLLGEIRDLLKAKED